MTDKMSEERLAEIRSWFETKTWCMNHNAKPMINVRDLLAEVDRLREENERVECEILNSVHVKDCVSCSECGEGPKTGTRFCQVMGQTFYPDGRCPVAEARDND